MRILYHHRTLADGAEGIHIREMIDAFASLGHDVSVMALAGSRPAGRTASPRRSLMSRVKQMLPAAVFDIGTLLLNVPAYLSMRWRLARGNTDFVYKRHAIYDIGIALAASHSGVPLVLEVNCPYSSDAHRRFEPVSMPTLARWCERVAFNRAAVLYAVSSPMRDLVAALCDDPRHARMLPNGANPRHFVPGVEGGRAVRQRYGVGADTVVVGWVGILRPWHRVDLLLEAVALTQGIHVLIVGDGPDLGRLQHTATSLGIDGRVTFTGRVTHAEMPAHVAAFDIAVAADDRTGYASPMKILEYMAMAKPVVAPRLRNIEDILHHRRTGLLFTAGSAEAMASALEELRRHDELRSDLGRAARQAIEQDLNWDRNASQVIRWITEAARPQANG